ncbi:MEKHLA domain-containing protein [Bradyrhizobium sp. Tv2a-2]|uniref:MEKHLA domain-containing protein n=1 Tax=Bradyrhizobium sp. Tv2a-2 TaxID=113395 RepID=UPI000423A1F4|nr:MEKHLA domain-containing protein [Bradyrhizobium sp. Tv2a-2]
MDIYDNSDARDLRTDQEFFALITKSFDRIVGTPLVPNGKGPHWLYKDAPFVVLAQNRQPDPRFIYANHTAQSCFGYSWEEFITLPSRLSAEEPFRAERQRLLDAVTTNGFIDDYRGLRIAKSGRRFWIEKAIVWQLVDDHGRPFGQAATFSTWSNAEGSNPEGAASAPKFGDGAI